MISSADDIFAQAIARSFSSRLLQASFKISVRCGAFASRLLFTSEALGRTYAEAFLPYQGGLLDVSIAVLTADDVDLSDVIPLQTQLGRAYVSDGYFALWHAESLPVFYVLDRRTRRGVVWLPGGTAPHWEMSRPACPLVQALTITQPWLAVHAGAVGQGSRVLMLAGKGRAGKSTAAGLRARGLELSWGRLHPDRYRNWQDRAAVRLGTAQSRYDNLVFGRSSRQRRDLK